MAIYIRNVICFGAAAVSSLVFMPIPSASAAEVEKIEEIIVTARKRSETVTEVPLAITAISSDFIEKANITGIQDIAANTPGLTFQSFNGGGLSSPVIRGLSQTDIASSDNNVGVFLDGAFINGKSNIDIGLLDIERVEVVKGPQSALYGRNSFAGAINYVLKKPGDELEAKVSVTAGTDELQEIKASIRGPLVEGKLGGSLSVSNGKFDGTLRNGFGGENLGGYDKKQSAAVNLVFTPSDELLFDLFYYTGETDLDPTAGFIPNNNCGAAVTTLFPRRGGDGGTYFCGELDAQDEYFVSSFAEDSRYETEKVILKAEYDFNEMTLAFAGSFGDYEFDGFSDQNYGSAPDNNMFREFVRPFVGPAEDESYEIRLQSNSDSRFQWLAGYYNFEGSFSQFAESFFFPVVPLSGGVGFVFRDQEETSNADAYFASGDYSVNDKLDLSLELRYTIEDKEQVSTLFGATTVAQDRFTYFTPRASATWALSDNSNIYSSYAKGVKSGGFNATSFAPEVSFEEETIDMYEFGYKTSANGLNLAAAVFFFDWDDLQFPSPTNDPAGFANTTQNIGKADGLGAEVELSGIVGDSFEYRLGAAMTKPEFDSNTIDVGSNRNCPDATLPVTGCSTDVSGNTIPRASEFQFNAGGTYFFNIGNSDFYVRGDLSHESEKYSRALNAQSYGEHTLLNARAAWVTDNWEVALWGKNITDEEYIRSSINEPEFGGFVGSPTTPTSSTFTTAFPAAGSSFGITVQYEY